MKKILSVAVLVLASMACALAQNVQFHYDFGRSLYNEFQTRPHITTTVEMYKPDKWGSTFFFIDMDYSSNGVQSAYWEISRELKFWEGPLSAHVEYNGGSAVGFSYNNAYMVGPTYTYNNKDFSKGFTLTAMYKYIQHNSNFCRPKPNSFQVTGTWYLNFSSGKYTFDGFADYWKEKTLHGNYIFLSEPQFWVNLNKFNGIDDNFKLSVGSELELSNNFANHNGFYAIPTLAMKWSF